MSIAVGDFNNDNHLDIVVANYYSNSVAILLGNENGIFGIPVTISTNIGNYSGSVAVGDFNKDGRLDVAVSGSYISNYNPDRIHILLNDGNVHFDDSLSVYLGQFHDLTSIVVADFNNDNQMDLAVTNQIYDNVGIMLGNGNGTFLVPVTYSTGTFSYPSSVIVGDFNNDNQLDLAVDNNYAHNVAILMGVGNGTFLEHIAFSTGALSMPGAIASGDFNSDGKLDLAITDTKGQNFGILLNTCECCILEVL
jgi:hypothetical protein